MINLFLRVMIHSSAEESRVKRTILTYEPMREQDAYHMTHVPQIFKLKTMEYFYSKLNDAPVWNISKQAAISASPYAERVYRDFRIFV